MVRYRKIPPAAAANQIAEKARIPPAHKWKKNINFFICACLVIFFDFLQSDWLQQRAAFYDIMTVVQKCYFFSNNFLFTSDVLVFKINLKAT